MIQFYLGFSSQSRRGVTILCRGFRSKVSKSKLLEVSGADTTKFLQGLCSNDLAMLSKCGDALPAAFLTPKGRILATTILYSLSSSLQTSVLIEYHELEMPSLNKYLSMYKLRSKVQIKPFEASVFFDSDLIHRKQVDDFVGSSTDNIILAAPDPRIAEFGARIISKADNVSLATDDQHDREYELRCILQGIADCPRIINRIPLECNLDLLHYISFSKGCYVGQELTARTRYKGLVRKRLVPFLTSASPDKTATEQTGSFDILSPSFIKHKLQEILSLPISTSSASSSTIQKGMKIFKLVPTAVGKDQYKTAQAVGEIIQIDSTGQAGLVMMNLDTLHINQGNFAVMSMPRESSDSNEADTAQTTDGATLQQQQSDESNHIGFISTYRPVWFHGLDEKTNLKLDL
jgi:folate-binding protein YgfZ